jgi:tRNA-guanine family transglycosylase
MYAMTEVVANFTRRQTSLLHGRGNAIIWKTLLGVDMFDCVMPTRNARNGICLLLTVINIKNKKWEDFSPLDEMAITMWIQSTQAYCVTCLQPMNT